MKKLFFALMACVAMLAFTSCNEKVESQIFDLGYEVGDLGAGTAQLYESTYKPMIIEALSKVAQPVTESETTFMINNSTPAAAKQVMKGAFDNGTAAAQKLAGDESLLKGLKVTLKHSTASTHQPVDFLEYTFK